MRATNIGTSSTVDSEPLDTEPKREAVVANALGRTMRLNDIHHKRHKALAEMSRVDKIFYRKMNYAKKSRGKLFDL